MNSKITTKESNLVENKAITDPNVKAVKEKDVAVVTPVSVIKNEKMKAELKTKPTLNMIKKKSRRAKKTALIVQEAIKAVEKSRVD